MIHALGYSHTQFNTRDPGRLCRGRERWIEPYEVPEDWELGTIHRLTISGAAFTDDSASDALRGVPHSKVDLAALITSLFPRRPMLAFMEDGHPADIPDEAEDVEVYEGYRAGGRSEEMRVRWSRGVSGVREIREVLGEVPTADRVRGFAIVTGDEDHEPLMERLFLLTGFATLDSPPAQFQPAALHEVLDMVKAVVLLHRDKHGPAIGVYSREPIKTDGRLDGLCEKAASLLVPFAIPPMLARWDRALGELKATWDVEERGEFPVPVCPDPHTWEPRRRRREREKAERTEGDSGSSADDRDLPPLEEQTVQPATEADLSQLDDLDALLSSD